MKQKSAPQKSPSADGRNLQGIPDDATIIDEKQTTQRTGDLVDAAREWFTAGFCVIPSHEDGTKKPFGPWRKYQTERMPLVEVERLLNTGRWTGIGVITGAVSGGVEMLEIDSSAELFRERFAAVKTAAETTFAEAGMKELFAKTVRGCTERSPGGGVHLLYRVTDHPIPGNEVVARTAEGKTLVETRGEGGFCIVAPTPGRKGHPSGTAYTFLKGSGPAKVVELTWEERELLHMLFASTLNEPQTGQKETLKTLEATQTQVPLEDQGKGAELPGNRVPVNTGVSPLDAYRVKHEWREVLEQHGWKWSHTDTERDYWVRPGKAVTDGHSASTITNDGPLYNFSSNSGLPENTPMTKGEIYAHYNHGGNLTEATRALIALGYGETSHTRLNQFISPGDEENVDEATGEISTREDAIFNHSPQLGYIRQLARAQMVSPFALLAAMVAIANAGTDPNLCIPDFINSRASLNTGIVLVSQSGGGKSGALRLAETTLENWVRTQGIHFLDPSSGEGILALFLSGKKEGGGNEQTRTKVVSTFDEIARIGAQADRSGATFMANLRTALTGGRLSTHSGDISRQRHLPPESYRWCLLLAAQPRTAEILLNPTEADSGTPQRFLWVPAFDSKANKNAPRPGTENPFLKLKLPVHGPTIQYPDRVREEVRTIYEARQKGEGNALDSHATLTRLKVAAGIAILHGTTTVSEEIWDLSKVLMKISDDTRAWTQKQISEHKMVEVKSQGKNNAVREIAADQTHLERATLIVTRYMHKHPESVSRRDLFSACGRYKRDWGDEAIEAAIAAGYIRAEEAETNGKTVTRYFPGKTKP